MELADAAAGRAEHADRMRLVHQQKRLVFLLQLDEPRELCDVAVHAVDAFHGDEHAPVVRPQLGELLLQRVGVVVREGPPLGARQLRPAHDAVLGQRIVEDQVLRTYGWLDRERGVVRIPIERALELVAKEGLPSRPASRKSP